MLKNEYINKINTIRYANNISNELKRKKHMVNCAIYELDTLLKKYKFNYNYTFLWMYRESEIKERFNFFNNSNDSIYLEIIVHVLIKDCFSGWTIERLLQSYEEFKLFEDFYKKLNEKEENKHE